MVPLSVLDLAPITAGGNARLSFRRSLELAQHAERLGYRRFWLAEHHNIPSVASAATAVLIAHVAGGTTTIRVGAGGIMLPNHAPLVIAEQFGTLESLHPGRIDLGLGRAPGSDQTTARALRRTLQSSPDAFPQDVLELMGFFQAPEPGQRVTAIPGAGLDIPIWILGSSLFGAQVAAALGLPFAFASHFAPAHLMQAIDVYRSRFEPSPRHATPYVMAGLNVIAAPTDDEARFLFSSLQQAFLNLRRGRPGTVPAPVEHFEQALTPDERWELQAVLAESIVGGPRTIHDGIAAFVSRTGVDELMIAAQIFDHDARLRSYALAAAVRTES